MLKVTKLLLILFLVVIISSVSLLFSGIKINSFSFNNISVSQFYIKLDKKLIVDIEDIEIKSQKSKVENSLEDIKKNLELLPKVLNFFQRIHVERLKIDGNEFTISLNSDSIYLDNKFINLSSKVDFSSSKVDFDLYSLYLKDIKVMFDGSVKVDYFNEKLNHIGKFYYGDINGDIKLESTSKKADFYINTQEFKSLSFLKNFFRLGSEAESWMYDKIDGDIKLQEFYGSFDIEKLVLDEKSIEAKAQISNAQIKFQKNLNSLLAKRVGVEFKKGNLNINLIEPTYEGISLDGSKVTINNLISSDGEILIDIKTKTIIDDKLLDLLASYGVKLPIIQKSGLTSGNVILNIPYSSKKQMDIKGEFLVEDSNILLQSFEFYAKSAKIKLDNSIVSIEDANVVHKDMIDAKLNLKIDTKTSTAIGDTFINSFFIKAGEKQIVHLKNEKTKLDVSFLNSVVIKLDDLDIAVKIGDILNVKVGKIEKIYKHSSLLKDLSVKRGSFNLDLKSPNDMNFEAFVGGLAFPIYKNETQVDTLSIKGIIRDEYISVFTTNGDLEYKIIKDNHFLDIENYMVYINTKEKSKGEIPPLNITAKNIDLKINEDIYYIVDANAKIRPKILTFAGLVKDLKLPLLKNGEKVTKLNINGSIDDNGIIINNTDKSIKLKIKDKKLDISLIGYDVAHSFSDEKKEDEDAIKNITIKAIKSNILLNEKFKFLADFYEIRLREDSKYFNLKHNKTELTYKENKEGYINLYGNDISDKFINSIFEKEILKGGNMMLVAKGPKSSLEGKFLLSDVKVEDLAILNNLLLFINTSPALINPLLAIPTLVGAASNDGFNLSGYHVVDGLIEFKHNMDAKLLDITKLVTIGNGIDFDGSGRINLNDATMNTRIKMIFLKDYSSIVGAIPVVNYVVLGSNKRVETEVNIFGPLANPKISTNLTKEAFSVPLNIAKRVLTSPIKFLEFLGENTDKKDKEKTEKKEEKQTIDEIINQNK